MECKGIFEQSYRSLMLSNRFRWVYCKLDVLRQCHRHDLRRILKESPRSLDDTYERILKKINNANSKQAHRLLQCLVATHRPLRIEELADVLALDVDAGGMPRLNAKWRWKDHEAAVLSACSSLVSVVNHEGSRVIQFCHVSAQEFLTSNRLSSTEDISQFHIADEPSHAILAQACLGALLSVDDPTSKDRAGEFPLSGYAYEYWFKHAQVGYVESQIRDVLDRLFDLDKPHFAAFFHSSRAQAPFHLRFFSESGEKSKGMLSPAAPFYFAAIYGLSGLAERLIVAKKPQILSFCGYKGTLLHLAVREGRFETARLLLAHGADINSRKDYATPPRVVSLQRYSQGPESHSERPLDSDAAAIDDTKNALPDTYVDASSEKNSDANMGLRERRFTPLHLAASEGYLDICQILLELNADVHLRDKSGNTALHFAASEGHLEVTRLLLKRRADANSQNKEGLTALQQASQGMREGHRDIVQLLLDIGANWNARDNSGNTALQFAASEGHLEAARMLLERGADVNSQNIEGLTALQRASQGMREGHRDTVRFLLDHGANWNACDNSGNSALHFAAFAGHFEASRMLLERGVDVNSQNKEGLTPLQRASQGTMREGHRDILRLLLDRGANWNAHDNSGNTALHFAASEGHFEASRMLLERGADVNSKNKQGLTALQRASQGMREGHRDIVRLFLDHGANWNARDMSGNTALHFTASEGHLEVARMLLEHGADVNSHNDEGLTPLHRASLGLQEGHRDIVHFLLDHGANYGARDKNGNTALHFSASEGHLEVSRILLEQGADVNSQNGEGLTPLQRASQGLREGYLDIMRLLLHLNHDAIWNARDKSGNTALHFAASEGHLEVALMLLKLGADVNSQNDEGLTPLQRASQGLRGGHRDIAHLFLDNGANVHMPDRRGNTALHYAASEGHLEAARVLLKHNAEVNSWNEDGYTAFLFALKRQNPDIVQLLLDHNADVHVYDWRGDTLLHAAVRNGDLDVCRILLERNVKVDSQNSYGSTPLLLASEFGFPDLVKLFLDRNADVHRCDAYGDTALHCAAIAGLLEISRLLLNLDVNINSRNEVGSTPLHLASAGYKEGNPDLVRLLLVRGADAQARNLSGKTASEVARGPRRDAIVRLFSEHTAQ